MKTSLFFDSLLTQYTRLSPWTRGCSLGRWKGCGKRNATDIYLCEHPGKVISRYQFSYLFGRTWMQAMTPHNICKCFEVTGIYPINCHKILPKKSPITSFLNRAHWFEVSSFIDSCLKAIMIHCLMNQNHGTITHLLILLLLYILIPLLHVTLFYSIIPLLYSQPFTAWS